MPAGLSSARRPAGARVVAYPPHPVGPTAKNSALWAGALRLRRLPRTKIDLRAIEQNVEGPGGRSSLVRELSDATGCRDAEPGDFGVVPKRVLVRMWIKHWYAGVLRWRRSP
jgi:hypothetical protein